VQAVDLAAAERELDAARQGQARVGLNVAIDEIRSLLGLGALLQGAKG
jgi:hypothetical protein